MLDVGGQTGQMGAEIAVADEIERVVPVVERLDDACVSVDTYRAPVAAAALAAGASFVNDYTGGFDPDLAAVVADARRRPGDHALPRPPALEPVPLLRGHRRRRAARARGADRARHRRRRGGGLDPGRPRLRVRQVDPPRPDPAARPAPRDGARLPGARGLLPQGVHGRRDRRRGARPGADHRRRGGREPGRSGDAAPARRRGLPPGDRAGRRRPHRRAAPDAHRGRVRHAPAARSAAAAGAAGRRSAPPPT